MSEIDEAVTARLLRLGGVRPGAPPDREDRVRDAVLAECRAVARARVVRRQRVTVAAVLALAAAAVVAIRVWMPRQVTAPIDTMVAAIERLEGSGGRIGLRTIAVADGVRAGDQFETDANGRVSLRLSSGVSLRFDHGSRARLSSSRAIELGAGAVYVDSGPQSSESTSLMEVRTAFGVVRDVGTQFEVRVGEASLRIRVRSGVVEVRRGARDVSRAEDVSSAGPGTELIVAPSGATSREVPLFGPDWAWAAAIGPVFEIEGRTLGAFLAHLCREQGWRLVYEDPKLALEASAMILHGSTSGLQPTDALAVVLATTGLTHRLVGGELRVARGGR